MGFDLPDRIKKFLIYCQTDVFCNPFVTQGHNGDKGQKRKIGNVL